MRRPNGSSSEIEARQLKAPALPRLFKSSKFRVPGVPGVRTLGPGSVSSLLKIALDVAYGLLILVTGLLFLFFVACIFIPIENLTVTSERAERAVPLTRALLLFGAGSVTAYFGAFLLILRSLRQVFRTLIQGDPFQPQNVRRLRQVGLILAVVTGGAWFFRWLVDSWLAPGVMDSQEMGELLTPIFSVLVVFVLAEVFREGARLRRESELTI